MDTKLLKEVREEKLKLIGIKMVLAERDKVKTKKLIFRL